MKRETSLESHIRRVLMCTCGAERHHPWDTCSLPGQGDSRLVHRASPCLWHSVPALILEASRKHSRLVSAPLAALLFTFQSHQLLFRTPEQPSKDPSGRINSQAVPVLHSSLVNPSASTREARWGRGSLGNQLFFLPGTHPGNPLWFSFLYVKNH